jgi:xanthine dehydrogenase YagT iron-sulfur-binding subunit
MNHPVDSISPAKTGLPSEVVWGADAECEPSLRRHFFCRGGKSTSRKRDEFVEVFICPLLIHEGQYSLRGRGKREESVKKEDDKNECHGSKGMSRRVFLKTVGVGAAAATAIGKVRSEQNAGAEVTELGEVTRITLLINGRKYRILVEPRWSLLFVIREKLGLTGTKIGCERGECGACTVLIDNVPRYACMTLAVESEGKSVTTLEGLMKGEELGQVQQAFAEHDAFQCGYCTPGQIIAVEGLLRSNPDPTLEEIQAGVSGNLCRCGAYVNIFKAAQHAAKTRRSR